MEMQNNQSGRPLAVVTGASSGIGYELAKVFARNGFDLFVVAEDRGIVEASNAFRAMGGTVDFAQIDLSQLQGVDELYSRIQGLGKPVDSLAINAGVGVGGEFVSNSWQEELNMINLNLVSTTYLAKKFLPDMITQGHGRLLFTSSVAAATPGPYYAIYAATKAYVQSFAEALHYEMKEMGSGIVVTALQPGATDTNFFARAHMQDTKAGAGKKDDPADVAQEGFDALMAGQDHVVAGSMMNKVQTAMSGVISEQRGADMQAKQVKPGSANS